MVYKHANKEQDQYLALIVGHVVHNPEWHDSAILFTGIANHSAVLR